LSAGAALAVALAAAAAGQDSPAAPESATRTALVTFADGNTLPLRGWTLSYDYISWARGSSPASGVQAGKVASALWLGKRVLPVEDAQLAIQYGELRRETLVEGRPQFILGSAAREVTVTTPDGKTIRSKVEPPHRDLLAPDADKSAMVMARSLDLRGESITGTRREVCLLSFSPLVECGATPADQVVKVQLQR
jgi:hypothetical protein